MKKFTSIGLIANAHVTEIEDSVRYLKDYLQSKGLKIWLEAETAKILSDIELPVFGEHELTSELDLVIVVGGDGSMLAAARMLVNYDVAVLGVNRGRLGFLTDILPDRIGPEVGKVLDGEYSVSNRFLLDVTISREGQPIGRGDSLNDVVLHPGLSVRMMEFELYIDGQFVNSQRSDGLIVSTPTGSTAYALAAGGPLLHPRLDAIVVVPMNPHTLSSRPIVIDGGSRIEIRVGKKNKLHPVVSCDGQNDITSEPGDIIHIEKKPRLLKLIHPLNHNYYETCRSKLGWSSRLDSRKWGDQGT